MSSATAVQVAVKLGTGAGAVARLVYRQAPGTRELGCIVLAGGSSTIVTLTQTTCQTGLSRAERHVLTLGDGFGRKHSLSSLDQALMAEWASALRQVVATTTTRAPSLPAAATEIDR